MKTKIKQIVLIVIEILILICIALIVRFVIIGNSSNPIQIVKDNCNISEENFQDRKIFTITPKSETINEKTILYFHGGSYVAEMSDAHWEFIQQLSQDTNSKIIIPDYPLVPKYNVNDVESFSYEYYKKLIGQVSSENIVMMGDSAGGGLALGLCEKLAEEEIKLPSKLILISPWLDVSLENTNIDNVQKNDKNLNKETLKIAGMLYAGQEKIKDYFASPIYGDLQKIKNLPITIYTGTYDILNPDVHELMKKSEKIQLQLNIQEKEKEEHIWIVLNNNRREDSYYKNLISQI